MTNYHMKTLLKIHDNQIIAGIALAEESLHQRNISHFGPTTQICSPYGMLRLCVPQSAESIADGIMEQGHYQERGL